MCKVIEDMRTQERKEAMMETALRMLKRGKYGIEEIADISGLTVEEVEELAKRKSA